MSSWLQHRYILRSIGDGSEGAGGGGGGHVLPTFLEEGAQGGIVSQEHRVLFISTYCNFRSLGNTKLH